jgi:hypothetical protein
MAAQFTDAQLRVLATDVVQAANAQRTAMANLVAAKKALATALGPGGSVIISGRVVTANADATDVTVQPLRVVT